MIWKILRLFFNILTSNDKYSVLNRDYLLQPIQIQWSRKRKIISYFFRVLKIYIIFLRFLKQRWVSSLMYFRHYGLRKTWLDLSKKNRSSGAFDKQHYQWTQTLLNSERENLYHIYWSLWSQLTRKKSLLVICKILTLFVITLTADDKYCLHKRDNLAQPIQMPLSQKQKIFLSILLCNFEI